MEKLNTYLGMLVKLTLRKGKARKLVNVIVKEVEQLIENEKKAKITSSTTSTSKQQPTILEEPKEEDGE
ncbi:MAG: hypothetical protein IJ565_00730 [Bacilli bacterium]|nr:hypothetical protein [Bacilli bacterium]